MSTNFVIWSAIQLKKLKSLINELEVAQTNSINVFCDNQSAAHICNNNTYHERNKHIDIRLHWNRDVMSDGIVVQIKKIHTYIFLKK